MPLPTQSDVHVNRPLTNVSIATIQDATNFVAGTVFPNVPVVKQSDKYWLYDNAYWNLDEMQKRGPSAESAGNGYTVDSSNTYFADVYAFHKDIDDQIRANADAPLNLDNEATTYVTLKALIKREKIFSSNFLATGKWGTDITGVSSGPTTGQTLQWNDPASDPIGDVWTGISKILSQTGFRPNVFVIGFPVLKALVNHPDFIDRVKYGQTAGGPAIIDTTEIAALLKVDKVVVMQSIETTSIEGTATSTFDFISGGKLALLCYAPPAPGLMIPSAGYTFSWTGYLGAGPAGNRIKRFRLEWLASDRVEIEIAFDMKLISTALGYFWTTIVA